MKKTNLAEVVKEWGENKPCNHPGDPENSSNSRAAAAVLEKKASAFIGSRAKLTEGPWMKMHRRRQKQQDNKIGAVKKATSIIVSRAVISGDGPLTGWHPKLDNIHPTAEEREDGITFERLYDIIRQREGSPPPSPHARRLPVFENISMIEDYEREFPPLPRKDDIYK